MVGRHVDVGDGDGDVVGTKVEMNLTVVWEMHSTVCMQYMCTGNRRSMKIVNSVGAITAKYNQQYCCVCSSFCCQRIRPLQHSTVATTAVAVIPCPDAG